MVTKINKKKIVGTCPVGMRKTVCPSIRKTRQFRTKLLALQREIIVDTTQDQWATTVHKQIPDACA